MVESEAGRVQKLSLESEVAYNPVDRIARDWQIDGGQMDADLVRPPRLEANSKQRVAREEFEDVEVRHSLTGRGRVEGDSRRVGAVSAYRSLDTTVL